MQTEKIVSGFNPGIMRRLLTYLKPYRGQTVAASAALLVLICSELLVPVLIQYSIDNHILSGTASAPGLARDSLLLVFLLTGGLAASFIQVYMMSWAGQGIMKTLRVELLEHTAGQSLSFLGANPVGSLVTRITNDVETISELFSSVLMTLIKNLLVMVGVVIVLFWLDARLAAVTVLSLPPVLVITLVFRKRARNAYRRVREKVSAVNSFLSERIAGMKVVQVFAREEAVGRLFGRRNRELLEADFSEMYVFAVFRPLISFLSTVSIAAVIIGASVISSGGAGASDALSSAGISVGVLIAFLDLVRMFFRPLQQISEQFTIMQSAMAGGERVFDLLDTEDRIIDCGGAAGGADGCADTQDRGGSIEFDNVVFGYREGEPVLRGVSFLAAAGETVAIVGYTGSGKTTIANLAARFWDADEGRVLVSGTNVRSVPLALLRRSVQAVQQDVFLFSGTIRENIALGRDFTDEQLLAAAETSCLKPVLDGLEDGLDHILAEGGTNLSGGQRQLVAFTRVIAHDPPVLILDEATASIDTGTEKLIQRGLKNLLSSRTAIVIAHRLSTIRDADRILVLASGRIIESGTHSELLEARGFYENLYRLQFGRS